ncbi:MAG: hypothetical protein ACI9EF_000855 [Pseudohongiellaceae bacterium]|jgi:hypothetical protein
MLMIRLSLLLALISGLAVSPVVSAQPAAGDSPQLTLVDGLGNQAPGLSGPFDSSGVLNGTSGMFFSADLAYLAEAQNNSDVPWGLLVSTAQTPFPTNILPPPLFVQPPFVFVVPTPAMLDNSGAGSIAMSVPSGLYNGTFFIQGIVQDTSSFPALKLSNGVRVDVSPPEFNARLSFARSTPALGVQNLEGVGHVDIDGNTLNQFPPFGGGAVPLADPDAVGLPQGFKFLPILPNSPDAPINPMARPVTTMTANLTSSLSENTFPVADTSGFPERGTLLVSFKDSFPWVKSTSAISLPKTEVVSYRGKTPTSFLNVKRKRVGSSGATNGAPTGFPHNPGEYVVGEFSMVTTSGALSRSRVSLDARNPDLVHVVIPQFSFQPAVEGTAVSLDLDLFLYEDQATKMQGFCVLDRASQTWRLIPGTEVDASAGEKEWNPMVSIAPDGRSMIAAVKVFTGDFPSTGTFIDSYDPDELWAIRLDGEIWPSTAQQVWKIDYELGPDPDSAAMDVRSRRISMPSVAIIGDDPLNYVAFVGLGHKFAQTFQGTNFVQNGSAGSYYAVEADAVRNQLGVRDYIDVPLPDPNSVGQVPSEPRLYISSDFGTVGDGKGVQIFGLTPSVSDDHSFMALTAGSAVDNDDMFVVDNVSITAQGETQRAIRNLSGHGGGVGAPKGDMRLFYEGGQGFGGKVAISPGGTQVAWVFNDTSSETKDWVHVAKRNGTSYGTVAGIYRDTVAPNKFLVVGDFVNNRIVMGLHFVDEDRLVFLMGFSPYNDPFGSLNPDKPPQHDVFGYTISTDTLVNITNTAQSVSGLDLHGEIVPAGTFMSPNREFLYVLRDGVPIQGNTVLAPGTEVTNILGIDLVNNVAFDISGDELSVSGSLPNLDQTTSDFIAPVESAASMGFMEGSGVQDGMMFFSSHLAGDLTETDELFGFDMNAPFVGLTITSDSPASSHISNITPDPFGARVAFAQTADGDPFGNTQHGFVADLAAFSFVRDLTPGLVSGGMPLGRFMAGSFFFLPPSSSQQPPQWNAGGALIFAMGDSVDSDSGVATQTAVVYYPLANVSDTLAEPIPTLLPLLNSAPLGPNYRIYLTSAGLSTGEP